MADLSGLTWDELLAHGAWLEKEADKSYEREREAGLGVDPLLMDWYLDYCDEIDRRETMRDAWRLR